MFEYVSVIIHGIYMSYMNLLTFKTLAKTLNPFRLLLYNANMVSQSKSRSLSPNNVTYYGLIMFIKRLHSKRGKYYCGWWFTLAQSINRN